MKEMGKKSFLYMLLLISKVQKNFFYQLEKSKQLVLIFLPGKKEKFMMESLSESASFIIFKMSFSWCKLAI